MLERMFSFVWIFSKLGKRKLKMEWKGKVEFPIFPLILFLYNQAGVLGYCFAQLG